MINNENYITIQGWMRNELNLKGNELLVYALIYGFSQDGESQFTGSARYIAEWIGSSRQTVANILKTLVDKGYIYKNDEILNGVKFCRYSAILHHVKKFDTPLSKNLTPPCQKSLHNNIEKKDSNKIDIYGDVPEQIREAFMEWASMRKAIKKPIMSKATVTRALNRLESLAKTDEEKIELIQIAIDNCWQGFYPKKKEEKPKCSQIEPPKYEFKPEKELDPSRGEITGMPEDMKRKYANYEKALGL